jgi:hypothetical protein
MEILDKRRDDGSSGVREGSAMVVVQVQGARVQGARSVRGSSSVAVSGPDSRSYQKGIRALNGFKIPSRWARLKKKQARVDWISTTNLQSTSNVFPFASQALEHILQRTRVPCTFRIQADPTEQEIRLLGICAMLYRFVRCARGMAPGCEQDNAREQSDRWCVEKL